jgi:TRAP-type C4-dicarboxylate transport system substrate-binding protein
MLRSKLLAAATLAVALTPMIGSAVLAADPALTLRLATTEDPDRPSQVFLDRFAAEVAEQSDGAMTVEIIYAAGGHEADKEAVTARLVRSGDVDLAVVPTRAWNDVGVTSLQALMAPFLVDNDGLLRAVGSDETVLQPMLEGLAEQGLVGLAIWPESLRQLFTFEENGPPIVKPADLIGQTIFLPGSALQNQIMEALGATVSNEFPPDPLVHDGTLRGAEYSLAFYNLYSPPATVTADVVFYPKFMTFVTEDAIWSRLTDEQQAIVRDAAAAARDEIVAALPTTAELVAAHCEQGGRAVLAGAENVAAFQAASQPMYDQMREDPFTAAAIDAVADLKAATPPGPAAEACEPDPAAVATAAPVTAGSPIGPVPNGTYVTVNTKEELATEGMNAMDASNNAGDWTWRVDGTSGTWEIDHPSGYHEVCAVTFEELGDRVRSEGCEEWMEFRWELDGDQLTVTVVAAGPQQTQYMSTAYQALFGGPWTKVE